MMFSQKHDTSSILNRKESGVGKKERERERERERKSEMRSVGGKGLRHGS